MTTSPVKYWRRQKNIRTNLNKKGTIITWTEVCTAPAHLTNQSPFAVVLVEFEDGHKAYGQLVDYLPEDLATGSTVRSTLRLVEKTNRDDEIIAYGLKFVPERQ